MNCYLLVGGRSRRMGRSKLDLPFGDATFLERVCGAARGAFDEVIAVQRPGSEEVVNMLTIFEEPHAEDGPIFGVHTALRHANERAFILAIDYPLITAEVLRELRARVESSPAPMVVPMWRGRPQLLCAGWSASLLPAIESRIGEGHLALRGLIDEAAAHIIDEADLRARFRGEPLLNVNTPEELEEAQRHL